MRFLWAPSRVYTLVSLFCLGLIIYSNAFLSSFHYDDIFSIVDNPAIRNIRNLQNIWDLWPTRFITYFTIAINYHFSKLDVLGYHIFNVAVHIASAMMVWCLVILTFATPGMKGKSVGAHARLIAFFTALVFIAHPVQTQGVAYIIQRAASLATFFYLASLCLYIKSRLLQEAGLNPVRRMIFYCSSLLIAAAAMFTKEIAITLPLVVLLYEVSFLKGNKGLNWKHLFPFIALLLVIPLTMFLTQSVDFRGLHRMAEPAANITADEYFLSQPRVMITYLRLVFIPLRQNVDYDYPLSKGLFEPATLASAILLVSILFLGLKIFRRHKLASFGIFWFFLTLLPESSLVPIRDIIAEHRLYLPMAGFSIFLISSIVYLSKKDNLKPVIIILLVLISCYSILTFKRNNVWKSELALWNDSLTKFPDNPRGYNNRGLAWQEERDFARALSDYNKAIELRPDYISAYNNRGSIYKEQGNLDSAIKEYNKAIELNPSYPLVYYNRGSCFEMQGNFAQAISDYTIAIKLKPDYAPAYNNRGVIYQGLGDINQAFLDYNKAIVYNPDYAEAYNNRGAVYQIQNKLKEAIADYNMAIKLKPDYADARRNRAGAYFLYIRGQKVSLFRMK